MVEKKHSGENDGKGEHRETSGGRDDMVGEKWWEQESGERKERPKLQKFNRRPGPKQRGLFCVRDPSQETQLENRLNRPSKLRNMSVSTM